MSERSSATPPPANAVRVPLRAIPIDRPPFRRLRVFAFDPSLGLDLDRAALNVVTLNMPWETDASGKDVLKAGPVGEYLEIVDIDPASDCCYLPVDLADPYLLAQGGLAPSEGNPQFHQQMVYAIAMATIHSFEYALGRSVLWAPRPWNPASHRKEDDNYVQRLRIYPHALREANAYYSPQKIALLFGYFPASASDPRLHLPGGMVFTCLSHDIVAHETTHAVLDGMHRRFSEPSNPDTLAFHEAFADIVALFQHFSIPGVLAHEIGQVRGDLANESQLGKLAQEFGQATGSHGALRSALGDADDSGNWTPKEPDPNLLAATDEPHARGSVLVAAVFRAFSSIYKKRTAALRRIATNGTGILPPGELHPDLIQSLSNQAAKSAQHVLTMCIRALDYCPPVDLTFGDYLRALLTADFDLVSDDDWGYRVAIVEAFRQWGIYPHDVRSLSLDSLLWSEPAADDFHPTFLHGLRAFRESAQRWDRKSSRRDVFKGFWILRARIHEALAKLADQERSLLKGLLLTEGRKFEVHSVRPARRVGPDGDLRVDLVIELLQRRPAYFDTLLQAESDARLATGRPVDDLPVPDFTFRGGGTLIVDLDSFRVRYYIYKDLMSEARLNRQRNFMQQSNDPSLRALYFGDQLTHEPFALLHRLAGEEEFL